MHKVLYTKRAYQIFELEDSGLPQQGIMPISAKNTITMATEVWGKKRLSPLGEDFFVFGYHGAILESFELFHQFQEILAI